MVCKFKRSLEYRCYHYDYRGEKLLERGKGNGYNGCGTCCHSCVASKKMASHLEDSCHSATTFHPRCAKLNFETICRGNNPVYKPQKISITNGN